MKLSVEKQHERMLKEPLPKLLLLLSLPTIASQMISVLYNTADTWFVSQISTECAAAVGVCFPLTFLIQAFGLGFAMGASNLMSLCLGAEENEKAECYAASAMFGTCAAGLFLAVAGLSFLRPLMVLFGATGEIIDLSASYAFYILITAPIYCGSFVLSNTLRAAGQSNASSIGLCIGAIINIILDPIFIFVLKLGIAGAAMATSLSQLISFIILLIPFISGKSIVRLKLSNVSKSLKTYKTILSIGFPTICRQGFGTVSSTVLNNCATVYGPAALATVNIVNKLYVFVRNIILGIGQGFQPIAGYNYGAGDLKRTKGVFKVAVLYGTIICVSCALLLHTFSYEIISWFRNDTEVIEIGLEAMNYICIVMPLMGFSTYVNQLYQCLGFKVQAAILASCRQGLCFLPLAFILPGLLGLTGVEMLQPGADFLTFVVSIPFYIWFNKNIFEKEQC